MVIFVITLVVNGLILWLLWSSNRDAIGLLPSKSRLGNLSFGFVASAILAAVGLYTVAMVSGASLTLNADFDLPTFLGSTLWMMRSVFAEELIFRGALLYMAIRWLGIHRACVLSSIAFGVYHWFSYSVFGDVAQMIYVFLLTGVGGLLFAYAFAVTKSMYLPVGLHLGWNIVSVVIFSQGPLGNQLLIASGGQPLGLWLIVFLVYQVTIPTLLTFLYLRRELLRGKEGTAV